MKISFKDLPVVVGAAAEVVAEAVDVAAASVAGAAGVAEAEIGDPNGDLEGPREEMS